MPTKECTTKIRTHKIFCQLKHKIANQKIFNICAVVYAFVVQKFITRRDQTTKSTETTAN